MFKNSEVGYNFQNEKPGNERFVGETKVAIKGLDT
jgi:hypothetical protein